MEPTDLHPASDHRYSLPWVDNELLKLPIEEQAW